MAKDPYKGIKTFLCLFIFIFHPLNAQILFRESDPFECQQIQNAMLTFYTEQLMQAGFFECFMII